MILIKLEAVRPYPTAKQARTVKTQTKSKVPLQEASNKINEVSKRITKKTASNPNRPRRATRKVKKDEYSLENLRDIFEDDDKKEQNPEFRATSTPFSSQLTNTAAICDEQIRSQQQLDHEINKIHDSINKESIILFLKSLSPSPSVKQQDIKYTIANKKPQKKGTKGSSKTAKTTRGKQIPNVKQLVLEKVPRIRETDLAETKKDTTKARSAKQSKKTITNNEARRDQQPRKAESKPIDKPMRRSVSGKEHKTRFSLKEDPESKPGLKPKPTPTPKLELIARLQGTPRPKVTTNTKTKPTSKSRINPKGKTVPRVRLFKGELSYKELLLKCVKGKDPIDLLL